MNIIEYESRIAIPRQTFPGCIFPNDIPPVGPYTHKRQFPMRRFPAVFFIISTFPFFRYRASLNLCHLLFLSSFHHCGSCCVSNSKTTGDSQKQPINYLAYKNLLVHADEQLDEKLCLYTKYNTVSFYNRNFLEYLKHFSSIQNF